MLRRFSFVRGAIVAMALAFTPSVAQAHISVKRSEPAKGSTIAAAPARIALWFTLAPPAAAAHVEHADYRWVRWLEFMALITVLGALGFRHGVLPALAARGVPTSDASHRARRLAQAMLLPYVLAAVQRAHAESAAVHGSTDALDPALLGSMLTQTTWGLGWLAGMAGAAVLFVGWSLAKRKNRLSTPLALIGGLGMCVSPALTGHAAAGSPLALSVAADVLHVLSAGVWTGGLLITLIAGVPAIRRASSEPDVAVAALVNSFHPVALFSVIVVALTGVTSSWLRLGTVPALWTTPYGRVLMVKLGVFAGVAALGAWNATRVRRSLGTAPRTRQFRITGAIEAVLAAAVLAVTTWLVVTPVPSEP